MGDASSADPATGLKVKKIARGKKLVLFLAFICLCLYLVIPTLMHLGLYEKIVLRARRHIINISTIL